MAKLKHQKRHAPRSPSSKRRHLRRQRIEEQRSRRDLERWRRG